MSAPAFRELESGIRAKAAALVRMGPATPRDFQYRDTVVDSAALQSPQTSLFLRQSSLSAALIAGLAGSAAALSSLCQERLGTRPSADAIQLNPSGYRIVHAATLQPAATHVLDSHIAAKQTLGEMVAANPSLGGKLIVIAEHELG
jgi:hypothetical protein